MPNAKRHKGSGPPRVTRGSAQEPNDAGDGRPTPAEIEEREHPFVELAKKNWLKPKKKATKTKVKNDVLKQGLWDLLEAEDFQYKSLLVLESLQTLET